jgi:hypothetical protein
MGKGGEQSIDAPISKQYKLSAFADDSLRKWAKAYGIKEADTGKRENLLELLVSYIFIGFI